MTKIKKARVKAVGSKPDKEDILTEMFKHFGFRMIDVTPQGPKPDKRKSIE